MTTSISSPPALRLLGPGDGPALSEFAEAWGAHHPGASSPLPLAETLLRPASMQRTAMAAVTDGQLAGVGRWQRSTAGDAGEILLAFVGPIGGAGPVLLRGLATSAWSCGVARLVHVSGPDESEVRAMFRTAGYDPTTVYSAGTLRLTILTAPDVRPSPLRPGPSPG